MTQPPDERTKALRGATERLLRREDRRAAPSGRTLWDADFFGLPRIPEFRRASAARQAAVLADCAAAVLSESWFIEKCGIVFCARMVLLAESDEERRLYSLIGADEARHSAWLEAWLADRGAADAFGAFIQGVAGTGGAQPLAYLLQVVLEGFGIGHYSSLAESCRDPALGATFKLLAHDEALHHAAGLAAFRASRLSAPERRFLGEAAYAFLQMMRSGPQSVLAALERHFGMSGRGRIESACAELDHQVTAAAKLRRLRSLMAQPGMEWLVRGLEEKGAFTPCTPAQCASIYAAAG